MSDSPPLSEHTRKVLRLLRDERNVLISGAPGTGKTRLLLEVQKAFESLPAGALYRPEDSAVVQTGASTDAWLPSPDRSDRKVFSTVFDPQTKYRDFLRGLVPVPAGGGATSSGLQFQVSEGTLYRANEHARLEDGTSLVCIDEINRGPAVHVFGASIVAIEPDKRLDDDNAVTEQTAVFELLDDRGQYEDYALSPHLYLVAAMNQADTSIEPLDVAFQRRWAPYQLYPDPAVLRSHFGLASDGERPGDLPEKPSSAVDVYRAAVRAWEAINRRIARGRGRDLQIGHGVLMDHGRDPPESDVFSAVEYIRKGWNRIRAHVEEVFYGDLRGVAAVFGVDAGEGHPFTLIDRTFAGQPTLELDEPRELDREQLYTALRLAATGE